MATYIPPGIDIPWDGLERGARTNNDGHGWAVASVAYGLEVGKSMDFTEAAVDLAQARERHGKSSTAIFHSRWGTHGVMGEFNIHPFYVDNQKQTVVAHNGILPVKYHPIKKDPRSDTRIFVDEVAQRFLSDNNGVPSRRRGIALGQLIGLGNKLLFLSVASGEPKVRIINAWLGEWEGGVWYSNSGYRPFRSYYNTGKYTGYSGWDDDWTPHSSAQSRRFSTPGFEAGGSGVTLWTPPAKDADDEAESSAAGLASGEDTSTCGFCGAKEAVDPLTAICDICETCADCYETAADCMCWSGSHHTKEQRLFDLIRLSEEARANAEADAAADTTNDDPPTSSPGTPSSAGWRSDVYD